MRNLYNSSQSYFKGPFCDYFSRDHFVEYPVWNGQIKNWDLMKEIWDYILNEYTLFTKTNYISKNTDDGIYLIGSINYTKSCYEKIMQFIFENYKISKVSFGIDSVNALYSVGKTTGLVVDSGESFTRILSIFQGHLDD